MTNAAERLVDHALGLQWADLDDSARMAARTFLHDTICVGIAGRNAPFADEIWGAAESWSGGIGQCGILGRPDARASAPYAAFTNAYQIHSQEYDCVHEPAVAHPMASVGAVLLAESQRTRPVSGSELLTAMAAGVDVVATLGVAVKSPLKFFRPATAGLFGSTAALARLRRLDRETTLDAFGYALAFASGTMQAHIEGKPTLAVQVAAAARSAVEAIDLAVAGLPGPRASIDGPFGYLTLFEDRVELEPALAELGRRHRVTELSWKPFPTGRAAHGAIVALQTLMREQGLTAADLESFTYRAPPLIHRLVGRRPTEGMSIAYARLCFAWLGAVVLTKREIGLDDFQPKRLADPALFQLAERIIVEVDDNPDAAAFAPAIGIARLKDGRVLKQRVDRQFGSPEWPLSREEHLAKARACLRFGGLETAYEPLLDVLDEMEHAADAAATFAAAFA